MDVEKLIERLYIKQQSYASYTDSELAHVLEDAITALSTLQDENEEMQKQLNMFSEFLCYMTGGLLSKTNYTAQEMVTAAEDYQQKVCGECDLRDENEKLRVEAEGMRSNWYKSVEEIKKLRAELEQVKAGRDAAIEYLREIEWCAGCKHFGGLDGCKKWAMGQCTEKHDLYEFIGPQKED